MPGEFYPKVDIINADKFLHMAIYGLLCFLCYISIIHLNNDGFFVRNAVSMSFLIATVYGASDEFHQYFVPNRSCELWDWLADFAGAAIAALIIKYYLSKRLKLFSRSK